MSIAVPAEARPTASPRARFVHLLAIGPPALALAVALLATRWPVLFPFLLAADLWLLGYPHVGATFTRLCFDRDSFRRYRLHVVVLLPAALLATLAATLTVGTWPVVTLYFYWQAFHYVRQSYGIERMVRRAEGGTAAGSGWTAAVLYLSFAWGVLHRSYEAPRELLGMSIRMLPVPAQAAQVVGFAALVALGVWIVQQVRAAGAPGSGTPRLYLLAHLAMVVTGYYALADFDTGWLVLNVWHNAQYLLLVWAYNHRRYGSGIDPRHPFLSTISARERVGTYALVLVGLSGFAYALLHAVAAWTVMPLLFAISMGINFHHYVVDALVWRGGKRIA